MGAAGTGSSGAGDDRAGPGSSGATGGVAAPGSNQSSVPGGTTPIVGTSSGPTRNHSVGTAGCAFATGVAPSCATITVDGWLMATSEATASTAQLV
jgi:hypothetical protein